MRPAVFILIVLLHHSSGFGKNYYFSESGNDNNNGTSKLAPWRSLARLDNVVSLKAGDSILFERGSRFYGTLSISAIGAAEKEIYIGAYGTGARPIITGSSEIKTWKFFRENIWVAVCKACQGAPADLFINGVVQPLGRFPNEGYRTITGSLKSKSSFSDPTLAFPDHFWKDAEVVVRSSRWTIDKMAVYNFVSRTFNFLGSASEEITNGYGYFIQNHLSTLDRNGEWFFDTTTNEVYLFLDKNVQVEGIRVEVSTADVGLVVRNSWHIRIENLAIHNAGFPGVSISNSGDVNVKGLEVAASSGNGLEVKDCRNICVENSIIRDSGNNGVEWVDNVNGLFKDNIILRTGLVPGRGQSGNGTYIALSVKGSTPEGGQNVIEGNRIDSTGYIGIDFRTGNNIIKNNIVSNFCLVKDDGGGIYTWGNRFGGNSVEGNIVLNGIGSGEGTPEPDHHLVSGIYIDDRSTNIKISGNTVAFCGTAGILIHNANMIDISSNRLYGNGNFLTNPEKAQLSIKLDAIVPTVVKGPLNLNVEENIFASFDESTPCVFLSAQSGDTFDDDCTFSQNLFRAPAKAQALARSALGGKVCAGVELFTLPEWQVATRFEQGSSFERLPSPLDIRAGKNLIRNSSMSDGTAGWMIWPDLASLSRDGKAIANGPSLRVEIPEPSLEALVYHAGIPLDDKKTYCLSFTAQSSRHANLEFVPLAATAPWQSVGKYTCFAIDSTVRTFTYFFSPEKSSGDARVNFKSNSTFWIDNVSLYEVIPSTGKAPRLVYNMTRETTDVELRERYSDMSGQSVPGKIRLEPYSTMVLFKTE